jgi:hypothetical protein
MDGGGQTAGTDKSKSRPRMALREQLTGALVSR